LNGDTQRFGACLNYGDRLWMTIVSDKKRFAVRNGRITKRHCFAGGGCFVQQGCIRNIERRQIYDHLLEIEQRLEPALRELRLVGCVSSVPPWVLKNVSLDDGRRDAIRIAAADERARDLVLSGNRAKLGQRLHL